MMETINGVLKGEKTPEYHCPISDNSIYRRVSMTKKYQVTVGINIM